MVGNINLPPPDPCIWHAPQLATSTTPSPVSFLTSTKVVTGSPPPDCAENPGGLNLMIENASISSNRVGYPGFNDPVDGQPATRYLDAMRVLSTTVREILNGKEHVCGSYQESVHRSINLETLTETEATSLASNPALWVDGPVVSDTQRKSGGPSDDIKLTHTLSVPHTVANFVDKTVAHNPFNGTFPHTTISSPYYSINSNKTTLGIGKTRIQWRWGIAVAEEARTAPPICVVRFSPADDPSTPRNESSTSEVVKTYFWGNWQTGKKSEVYEIDPLTLKGQVNGTYSVSLIPVEVVDCDKEPTTELEVAKMQVGAFNTLDPSGKLSPGNSDECFYIRVSAAGSVGGVSVKVSTTDNPDNSYNDDATQIDLKFDGSYWNSESMLMVSDDVDDDQPVNNVADDTTDDRTHKVQLGGNFKIEAIKIGTGAWQTADFKTPVRVKKTVHVNVVIMRDKLLSAGGQPLFDLTDAIDHWKIVSERYAQVGVKVVVDTYTYCDPPAGVNLSDGLKVGELGGTALATEAKAVITNLGTIGTSDIHVFYVPRIDDGSLVDHGVAIADYYYDEVEDPYTYNAFIAKDVAGAHYGLTAAHELGHLLTNEGHGETTNPRPSHHLMFGGGLRDIGITGSKRLYEDDEEKIWKDPHVQ